jgi:hypothetical protein
VCCIEEETSGDNEYVAPRLVIAVADGEGVPIREPVSNGDPEITGEVVAC